MKELICIGTSFTWGDGVCTERDSKLIKLYKERYGVDVSRKTHSFPSILEKLSGIKTRNVGKCGSSIEYLIRNVEELLETEDLSNTKLILEYSNWGRSELYWVKGKKYVIANWGHRNGEDITNGFESCITEDYAHQFDNTPYTQSNLNSIMEVYDKYLDEFHDEKLYMIQSDRSFLNLLYKLSAKNIDFVIVPLQHYFWPEMELDTIVTDNHITFKNGDNDYYGLESYCGHYGLRTMDLISDVEPHNDNGHPSIHGYDMIANVIYKNLKENGTI
jgi:hypothetical protein